MMNLYSLYDLKAEFYMTPFVSRTDKTVLRDIFSLLSDPNTVLAQHPEDFVLYRLGVWSEVTGDFLSTDKVKISSIDSLVKRSDM